MSDEPTKYVLKEPIAIDVEKIFNGQVYELPFRQWGMKNNHSCISQETLDEFFVPVSDLSSENQPKPTPLNNGICIICKEEITAHQDALVVSGIGLRHNYDCDLLMDSPVSVASENLKQQIEQVIADAVRKTMPYNATTYQEYSIGVTEAIQEATDAVVALIQGDSDE